MEKIYTGKIMDPDLLKPDLIIVDDHLIFRQSLKSLVTLENMAVVIGEASDGQEFITLLSSLKPDLVLMDIEMPGMNGIEASRLAMQLLPGLKIIAFTMFGEEEYFKKMVEIGVKGFILKSGGISELEKAIEEVMAGGCYFSKNLPLKIKRITNRKNNNSLPGNSDSLSMS